MRWGGWFLRKAHSDRQKRARADPRFFKGMRFIATMQPRTPLYVLERDGARQSLDIDVPEPDYEPWAGLWQAEPKSFGSIGIDIPEPEPMYATHAGPLPRAEILPFLMEFRRRVEDTTTRDEARLVIEDMRRNNRWAWLIDAHGGCEKLIDASELHWLSGTDGGKS